MQRKLVGFVLALALMLVAVVGMTSAQTTTFDVTLTGEAEVPGPGDPDGMGTGLVSITGNEACFTGTVSNVDLPIIGLHIHDGGPTESGPVVVNFGPSAANPDVDGVFAEGEACGTADAEVIADILANPGEYYVNVHTNLFTAGAVRGQLTEQVDGTGTPGATGTPDGTTTPDATGTDAMTPDATGTDAGTPDGTGTPQSTVEPTSTVAAGPAPFALLGPPNGAVVRDTADVTAVTWELSAGADAFNFILFKLSNNTRIGEVLNVTISADACGTTAGVCTLPVDAATQSALTDGEYAWTVVALSGTGSTEASNAPFLFTVNTAPVQLVVNPGFESLDEDGDKTIEPWALLLATGDRLKCNNATKTFSFEGDCAFQFKGNPGENSRIQQNLDGSQIFVGDTLTLSLYVRTNIADPGRIATLKVNYVDRTLGNNGKTKLQVSLDAGTGGVYQPFSDTGVVLGAARNAKINLRNTNTSGKIFVDLVQVIGSKDAPVEPTATATTDAGVTETPGATETTDAGVTETPGATETTDPGVTGTPEPTGTDAGGGLLPLP